MRIKVKNEKEEEEELEVVVVVVVLVMVFVVVVVRWRKTNITNANTFHGKLKRQLLVLPYTASMLKVHCFSFGFKCFFLASI